MATLRVGLTGGLASGKSTVARQLAEAGFEVVDADLLVAALYRPGGAGSAAAAALFGDEVLAADGSLDKVATARRIFRDQEARQRLEAAIHPLVRRRFAEIADQCTGIVVLEATKLIEAGYAPDFDLVVTVEAPEAERLRRAVDRGLSPDEAQARIEAQAEGPTRRGNAGWVIENDQGLGELRRRVDALIAEIRQRESRRSAGR